MQWHNDSEATMLHQSNERTEYTGFSHFYEPSSSQTFQQQVYSPPMPEYGPVHYGQQPFAGTPPYSDSRFSAVLSYSFGWLTGLLFILFGGKNRFVRFHALQSLVFFGMINVVDFGLVTIMTRVWHYSDIHILLFGCILFFLLLNFIAFVSWIAVIIQAARGIYFRLPFVGELVARCFDLHARPRW
ncbi:MAG: hypothetical protein JO011_19080 [Ktedonobacteraceae bacterium]|nr:hypothetical protein [Ktedonobacteraceae bacterium]